LVYGAPFQALKAKYGMAKTGPEPRRIKGGDYNSRDNPPNMILLSLLFALLVQYAYPPPVRNPVQALYGRLALSVAKRFNAGDRNSGMAAWFVLAALVLVPFAIVTAVAAALHPFVSWMLNVAVLFASLRFLETVGRLETVERSLRSGSAAEASARLAEWRAEGPVAESAGDIVRLSVEQGVREAHYGTFALILWFALLPGALGVVLYQLAHRAARLWSEHGEPDERDFGWFAARAFAVLDWLPQRCTAFSFAIVGNFEDALFNWRQQAADWFSPDADIVLASGVGALGIRPGETSSPEAGPANWTAPGAPDPADVETLASLSGMLWRCLVLWLFAALILAAASLA
jgi:cobalamin biosynthesis protein CobD/CbiB